MRVIVKDRKFYTNLIDFASSKVSRLSKIVAGTLGQRSKVKTDTVSILLIKNLQITMSLLYIKGQFLSGVWIQSFPSPRQFASLRLKNQVCPTIYP